VSAADSADLTGARQRGAKPKVPAIPREQNLRSRAYMRSDSLKVLESQSDGALRLESPLYQIVGKIHKFLSIVFLIERTERCPLSPFLLRILWFPGLLRTLWEVERQEVV